MSSNDNHIASADASTSDAQGQAALLLVESLLHGLVERSVLTLDQGVEIVQTAIEVQVDVANAADGAGASMWQAHALLTRLVDSLSIDTTKS